MDPDEITDEEFDECPLCGPDCICEEVESQYQPMQTDDAAVDHSVWTLLGKVLA